MDKKALEKAMTYCAKGEHCIYDIRQKLRNMKIDDDNCQKIIDTLIDQGFIDENRYANAFVADKVRFDLWGFTKIRYALRAKYLSDNTIDQAIANIEPIIYETSLRKVLKNKHKMLKSKPAKQPLKQALIAYAMQRGYEYSAITAVITDFITE